MVAFTFFSSSFAGYVPVLELLCAFVLVAFAHAGEKVE
jgi:hypothetical protein